MFCKILFHSYSTPMSCKLNRHIQFSYVACFALIYLIYYYVRRKTKNFLVMNILPRQEQNKGSKMQKTMLSKEFSNVFCLLLKINTFKSTLLNRTNYLLTHLSTSLNTIFKYDMKKIAMGRLENFSQSFISAIYNYYYY